METAREKIAFIINPVSGTHKKDVVVKLLSESLCAEKYSWSVRYTERAGHATLIAAELAKEGTDIVVAVGGDGTVNEVARSLIDTPTALGIIPCGSGNGLARHLQIPMEEHKAIDILNAGYTEQIDYGKINDTPFFCTCGVGFDAFVSMEFAEAGTRGILTYLEKALQEWLKYRPETYEIETESSVLSYKAFLIACGNASQYGNNAYIAPKATITDGLLDVTIIEPFTVLDIPQLAFQLFNKSIDQNSRIKTFRCKRMHIRRAGEGVVHFDGEPMTAGSDIQIEVLSKRLKVVIPEETKASKVLEEFPILRVFDEVFGDIARMNKNFLRRLTKKE